MKYLDLKRLESPGSDDNVDLFLWHQKTLHSEVTWSRRATQPTYTGVLPAWEVLYEIKSGPWPVTGSFMRVMPSTPFEKYRPSYLLHVAPNSCFAMPQSHIYSKFQGNTWKIQHYGKTQIIQKSMELNVGVLLYMSNNHRIWWVFPRF